MLWGRQERSRKMKDINWYAVREKIIETKVEIWRDRKRETLVLSTKDLSPEFHTG